MSEKERKRLGVMEQVKCGAISIAEAAESLGLSYRQARRVHTRFVRGGVSGLLHAGCGKESNRRLDEGIRDEALEFYEQHLEGYGPTLAAEVLAEDFDVHIHRETLRRLLHEHHLIVPRCRERLSCPEARRERAGGCSTVPQPRLRLVKKKNERMKNHLEKRSRGHFYCGETEDISIVA